MNANDLRQILADALDGAAERLRDGIGGQPIAASAQPKRESPDPLPGITKPTLTVDEAAGLLGVSTPGASTRRSVQVNFLRCASAGVSSYPRMHCGVGWQSPMGALSNALLHSEPLDRKSRGSGWNRAPTTPLQIPRIRDSADRAVPEDPQLR
jgi:hypothetical protein